MQIEEESFDVNGSTDAPVSNVLEKGRYSFKVKDITSFISKAGNNCIKVILSFDGKLINDTLMQEGQMSYKWRQFLYAIGIRKKATNFSVPKSKIVGAQGLADVGVKDRVLDDGSTVKENRISSYSPISQEVAPIKGVEPEEETAEVVADDGL